jgi:DNA mismatch repair protein MutS
MSDTIRPDRLRQKRYSPPRRDRGRHDYQTVQLRRRAPEAIASPAAAHEGISPMDFHSILFETDADRLEQTTVAPDYFTDLNCDQIVDAITSGKDEYDLKPFFFTSLQRVAAIEYRHAVMQDLENSPLFQSVNLFAQKMRDMRQYLARVNRLHYKEQQEAWFLDAIENYCETIGSFAGELSKAGLKSNGFIGFHDYLSEYASSALFSSLCAETKKLKADLSSLKYSVLIKGDKFIVRKYDSETDYSAEVEAMFDKFAQGAVKDYRVQYKATEEMNHIEAKILEFVAKLHPDVFGALEEYCKKNAHYLDNTVAAFDREIQFYISYLDYIAALKRAGLSFCYPRISVESKEVYDCDAFDIALARKLVGEDSSIVCNDFFLRDKERIFVVTGPNQGGKTTFARMFGQLHYLASIGCPVPGSEARLFLFDRILTHFEKEEKVENLRGKLEDDLVRIRGLFEKATPQSIVIMNEVFTSTTLQDESFLSTKVMEKVIGLDLLCVWVTFVDELASFAPQTASMVSTVAPDNPAVRTFKIVRRAADGLAYAMAIAQKYRLTYDSIEDRIKT